MNEQEPKYIKDLREHLDNKIDTRFSQLEKKIEEEVRDLAISTNDQFAMMDARFDLMTEDFDKMDTRVYNIEMYTKEMQESLEKIEGHIGRYEVRATNTEQILLLDHKVRITNLEKAVFV